MKTTLKTKFSSIYLSGFSINSVILMFFLLAGIVLGAVIAKYTEQGSFLSSFETDINNIAINGVGEYSLLKTFFNSVKFPAVIFLFGFPAFGIFLTPVVVFLKGCLLSISVSLVINSFGTKGFFLAVSIFGIQTLVLIPCIVLLSSYSMEISKGFLSAFSKFKKNTLRTRPQISSFIIFFLVIAFLLFLFSVLDVAITPKLVALSTKSIL